MRLQGLRGDLTWRTLLLFRLSRAPATVVIKRYAVEVGRNGLSPLNLVRSSTLSAVPLAVWVPVHVTSKTREAFVVTSS